MKREDDLSVERMKASAKLTRSSLKAMSLRESSSFSKKGSKSSHSDYSNESYSNSQMASTASGSSASGSSYTATGSVSNNLSALIKSAESAIVSRSGSETTAQHKKKSRQLSIRDIIKHESPQQKNKAQRESIRDVINKAKASTKSKNDNDIAQRPQKQSRITVADQVKSMKKAGGLSIMEAVNVDRKISERIKVSAARIKSTMDPAWLQKELEKLKEENARLKRDKQNAAEEWKSKLEEERRKIIELQKDNKKLIEKEMERKKKKAEWMERQKGKRDKAVKIWQKSKKRHVVNKKKKIESESSDSDTDDPPKFGFWYGLGAAIFGDAEYLDKLGLATEADLKRVFREVDANKDEVLDFDEFQACCTKLRMDLDATFDAKKEFVKADADDTGYLDFGEFRVAILSFLSEQRVTKLTEKKLMRVFKLVDVDQSGVLDFKEFTEVCKLLQFGATHDTRRDLRTYFKEVDTDGSGFISFKELKKAILL